MVEVCELTAERWPALEELFGRAGASNGCWCMYWRLGPAYARRPRNANRESLNALVAAGPAPGLIAMDGDHAVGWCQVTARDDLAWLARRFGNGAVDPGVWAISCFYVARRNRRVGIARRLAEAAVEHARLAGATAVEAYPVDTHAQRASTNLFTGTAGMFASLGFAAVRRVRADRPVMRRELRVGDHGARG